MDNQRILYAKNGIIDKDYLLVLSVTGIYKIKIKRINKVDDNTVTSVGISDERYPGQVLNISAETSLLEFDEVLYNTAKKLRTEKVNNKNESISKKGIIKASKSEKKVYNKGKSKIKQEVVSMPQNKNPRSKVIDKYLASLTKDEEPDYQKIVDLVVESGRGTLEDAKKIIFQAKLRYKWYKVDGKVNPFTKDNGAV